MNRLILGDNLEILKNLESESVDLIYLDPPFFSNRNYEVIWGDKGEVRSFEDRWAGGVDHYIAWLKERVEQMHRILKSTGSIFLHCDWHADAYIRVFILDKIFGQSNFVNEIIWCYNKWSVAGRSFSKNHDSILFYSKSQNYKYNQQFQDRAASTLKRFGKNEIISAVDNKGNRLPSQISEKESKGVKMYDWWQVPIIAPSGKERIGYPTQKPEALLERIIQCASNEGDVILDPFVGGGTTVAVAERLKRKWIGIDQSVQAVKVSEMRLQKQKDLFSEPFSVHLHKYDYDTLRYSDAFEFETWIVQQYGGTPNAKQRGDLGLDGKTKDGIPIQVKRSDNIGRNVVDNFFSAIQRFDKSLFAKNKADKKPVGIIIAFSFGKGAVQEVSRLKNEDDVIIQLVTVDKIIPIAKKPKLNLVFNDLGLDNKSSTKGMRSIEFIATGESEAGIEFYAWDFSYAAADGFKADILIDKTGQQTHTFKAGTHCIAVKVVDNEGLESLETISLTVNGVVKENKICP